MREVGEIGSDDAVNTETASYACVLLDWLLHWSPGTRASVLLEQLLQRKGQRDGVAHGPTVKSLIEAHQNSTVNQT